ncbi:MULTISPECIES: type II secretion system F family protein [Rhodobacterales]|jgi:tight adherence protein C|uniref:type II secretion system F family protein n=1 Tax=Rhodobacterales TaxID=204455 RepID=UPI00237F8F22|nr:type II secretion system F family protein [Phaeobacter gallaeciensis]MDE4097082.1 type II secretion system F family protein [Phaeobacter gallaeciensis]MDE4105625.1 type II secretion system F family protein [Phaeobacter gallaeciensis]MDE4110349.1 type II secretion system F family protein [Phaeobacter gallaeciensis]MDE4114817.1 type II secretion system F family protein [Phaeobacter gallaeciensis]MDE4119016.1 type II secretion system F family protein [Phaeobacter gallaeciensis]
MSILSDINGFLTDQFGAFGPLLALGLLGLFMILLAIPLILNQPEDPLKKLQKNMAPETQAKPQKERLRQANRNEQLQKFASFLEPQNAEELSAMELKLRQAGYASKDSVRLFHFAQFALGLLGLGAGLFYVFVLKGGTEFDSQQLALRIIGPGGAGYMLPKYWVTRRIEERKKQITQGFPDALDMMLVCVEAGQSLDQSIVRVAKELHASYPALAEEFEVVAYEMKAGKEREKVLRDMGTRCGVQDVSSFTTVMIQSQAFGTSIADALRVYADEMRDKRVMRAEEAANKLPVKMTLATMGLTVPPLLIILVGPSVQGILNMGNMGN